MDGIDLSLGKSKLQFSKLLQCAVLLFYFCACSCARFLTLPMLLSLPRQIPAVIPSTQHKELPIRLCWTLQRLICATAPPHPHQLLGASSFPRSAGNCKERSTAAEHHGSTQGTTTSHQRTKQSKLLEQNRHCFFSTCSSLLPLNNAYSFFLFPLGYFSSPIERSSRLFLVHSVPLSHFYMSNYRMCVWSAMYTYILADLGIIFPSVPLKLGQRQWNQWFVCSTSTKQPTGAVFFAGAI